MTATALDGLRVDTATSFADVDAGAWNSLRRHAFFSSARWLSAVEGTLSPDSGYALIRSDGSRPLAGLAAYCVRQGAYVSLDPPALLLRAELRESVTPFLSSRDARELELLVGRLEPELRARYPVAVSVAPYSSAAGIIGTTEGTGVAERLAVALRDFGASWGAKSFAFLNLHEADAQALAPALRRTGYMTATLAARSILSVRWESFDGYLRSLPSTRRSSVRHELRAFAAHGLELSVVDGTRLRALADQLAPLYATLRTRHGQEDAAREARETLEWIDTRFRDLTRLVLVEAGGTLLAFHLLFEAEGALYSYIGGQTYDEHARKGHAYFNGVYYEPLRLALRRGLDRIDYGTESYEAKVLRGCVLQPLTGFFDFGADVRDDLARMLELLDAGQRALLASCGRPRRGGSR